MQSVALNVEAAMTAYKVYRALDTDHSGAVNVMEFMQAFRSSKKQTGDRAWRAWRRRVEAHGLTRS